MPESQLPTPTLTFFELEKRCRWRGSNPRLCMYQPRAPITCLKQLSCHAHRTRFLKACAYVRCCMLDPTQIAAAAVCTGCSDACPASCLWQQAISPPPQQVCLDAARHLDVTYSMQYILRRLNSGTPASCVACRVLFDASQDCQASYTDRIVPTTHMTAAVWPLHA